jgi:hypothetical protein
MVDPYCHHALSAKVPSEGAYRTVSANISDYNSYSASQDATTSDYYIAQRYVVGLDNTVTGLTMDNSTVSAESSSDSIYQASLTDLDQYRVVNAAVRITYTGAPLNAQGYVRITKVSPSSTTGAEWPDSLSELAGLYWDFTPHELMEGVTVLLHPTILSYKSLYGLASNNALATYEGVQIMAVGLASTATIAIEIRQTIEFVPYASTTAALVATPNHKQHPMVDSHLSKIASTAHIFKGPAHKVSTAIGHHIWDAIKGAASKTWDAGKQWIATEAGNALSTATDSIVDSLPELFEGALALL